jgi:hypothetical protein
MCTRHMALFAPNGGLCVHGPCAGEQLNALQVQTDEADGVHVTMAALQKLCKEGGGAFKLCEATSEDARGPAVRRPEPWKPKRQRRKQPVKPG